MRVNSFIKINNKDFKKTCLLMIKKNFNKFVELMSKEIRQILIIINRYFINKKSKSTFV